MATRTEKIHGLVEEIYKNLGENFTPATRQLVNAGRNYMRTQTASNNAAKIFYEAVSKVGQSAGERYGITKDIGSALIEIADLHRDLHMQTSMMLKSFNLDYMNFVDSMVEQDLKNIQGEYKKYQSGNRYHMDAYDKALSQLKKQRKKNNRNSAVGNGGILKNGILNGRAPNCNSSNGNTYSSIDTNLNTLKDSGQTRKFNGAADVMSGNKESEMKHTWQLNEVGKQLDEYRIQSLKMAYANEKQCYTKILEKHCNRIKCMLTECQKIIMLFQHKIEVWTPLFNSNNLYHSPELDKIIGDNMKMLDHNSTIYDVLPKDKYHSQIITGNTLNDVQGKGRSYYNAAVPPNNGPHNYIYGYVGGNKGANMTGQTVDYNNYNPLQNGYYAQGRDGNPNGYEPDTYDYLYSSTLSIMSGYGGANQTGCRNPADRNAIQNGAPRAVVANGKLETSGRNSSTSSGFVSGESMGSMASNTPVNANNNATNLNNGHQIDGTYDGRSISEVYAARDTYANPLVIARNPSLHDTNAQHYRPHSIHQSAQIHYDGYGPSPYMKTPILHNGKTLVKALYPYHKKANDSNSTYDTNQLELNEGDMIALTPGVLKNGWHFGDNLNTGKSGWFPLSFTEGVEGPQMLPPQPTRGHQSIVNPYGAMPGALKRTDSLTNESIVTIPKINHSRSEHDLLGARGHENSDNRIFQKPQGAQDNWHPSTAIYDPLKQNYQGPTLQSHDTYTHIKNTKQRGIIYEDPAAASFKTPTTYSELSTNEQPAKLSHNPKVNDHPSILTGLPNVDPLLGYNKNEVNGRHSNLTEDGALETRRKRDKSLENIQKQQHLLLMANAASEPRSPSSASTEYPTSVNKVNKSPPHEENLNKTRPRTPLETLLPKLLEVESEIGSANTVAMNSQLVDRELDKRANLFSELKDKLKKRGGDTNAIAPGLSRQDNGYVQGLNNDKRSSIAYKSEGTLLTPPVPPTPPPLPPPNRL